MAHSASFVQALTDRYPEIPLRLEESMAAHTTIRIGGPAECMAFPKSAQQLATLLRFARKREIPCLLLGAGSNLLAPDDGIRGIVIQTRENMTALEKRGEREIFAQSGATLARLAHFAAEHALSGLEFAQGIPGTVGGGVYMNAGAYDGQMADVTICTHTVDLEGNLHEYPGETQGFAYRKSVFMENGEIITAAQFRLSIADREQIQSKMRELASRRREKQPLDLPSAGSAFKRPVGGYAAALIDAAGLKGLRVGGAAVSEKHAGFIVNLGGATADDVRRLIEVVQQRVLEHSGILLEPEIRIL